MGAVRWQILWKWRTYYVIYRKKQWSCQARYCFTVNLLWICSVTQRCYWIQERLSNIWYCTAMQEQRRLLWKVTWGLWYHMVPPHCKANILSLINVCKKYRVTFDSKLEHQGFIVHKEDCWIFKPSKDSILLRHIEQHLNHWCSHSR